jgi:hypothetical protein
LLQPRGSGPTGPPACQEAIIAQTLDATLAHFRQGRGQTPTDLSDACLIRRYGIILARLGLGQNIQEVASITGPGSGNGWNHFLMLPRHPLDLPTTNVIRLIGATQRL